MAEFSNGPQPRQRKSGRRTVAKASPGLRQTAKVINLAEEKASTNVTNDVEARILLRIQKCLDRANHPKTPELEGKAALRMSSRLMAQYNMTQADVLAQTTEPEEQARYAGQSTVSITSTRASAKVNSHTWVHHVVGAMEMFFNCKSYSAAKTSSIDWTFYGIAANTGAAAKAFEIVHNLAVEWARGKKGANSYCLGLGEGLVEMAKEEKELEIQEVECREQETISERLKQERLERRKQLYRLNVDGEPDAWEVSCTTRATDDDVISSEAVTSEGFSNDDGLCGGYNAWASSIFDFNTPFGGVMEAQPTFIEDNSMPLDSEADLDEKLRRFLKRERPYTPLAKIGPEVTTSQTKLEEQVVSVELKLKEESEPPTERTPWSSVSQLALFRITASKIADEYLRLTGIQLSSGRPRTSMIRDPEAYEQGRKDSRKIDVKRRRIESVES